MKSKVSLRTATAMLHDQIAGRTLSIGQLVELIAEDDYLSPWVDKLHLEVKGVVTGNLRKPTNTNGKRAKAIRTYLQQHGRSSVKEMHQALEPEAKAANFYRNIHYLVKKGDIRRVGYGLVEI